MARPNVPKFGDWGNNDNVPYTVCFDKARKTRKMSNPNDLQENPEMFRPTNPSPPPLAPLPSRPRPRPIPEEQVRRGDVRPAPELKPVREDFDLKHFGNSSSRNDNVLNNGGQGQKPGPRPRRVNMDPDQSFEPSPLHPHFQPTGIGKRIGSPVRNERNNENIYVAPGKSRLTTSTHRVDDKPETGPAIPKFGDWDDNPNYNPNYTEVFYNWHQDKKVEPRYHLGTPNQPLDNNRNNLSNKPKHRCIIL